MLGGVGAAFSKDVPSVPRRLAWSGGGGLAAGTGFAEPLGGGLCRCHGCAQYGAWRV